MARRKKTPDVLADQTPQVHDPTLSEEHIRQSLTDRTVRALEQEKQASSSDPYAALFPSLTAGKPSSSSARVKLEVTASEDLARKVRYCILQALSALPDAQLVPAGEGADWTLIVLGAPIQPPHGKTYGVALSAVAIRVFDRPQESQSRGRQSSQADSIPVTQTAQPGAFRGTWLRIGALAQVQKLCEQLVSDFSRRYLEF